MQASGSSIPVPFPPQRICILGAGRFGYLAARRLGQRYPEAAFLVSDHREEKLEGIERDFGSAILVGEPQTALENLWVDDQTWIIPAVPVHVACQWLVRELKKAGRVEHLPIPAGVEEQIPNPYRATGGAICASFATFICPDTCNEPDEICTHTKSPRRGNLFEKLAGIEVPGFDVIVVRSWQLAPGVGGYPKGSLTEVLKKIRQTPQGCYLLATSCRCHGVIDALSWEGAQSS